MDIQCSVCGKMKDILPNDKWVWSIGGFKLTNCVGNDICPSCAAKIQKAIDNEIERIRK